jgi:hypothetical protein
MRCHWLEIEHVTMSLTVRAFQNKVQRRIFGPKREEVTKDWKKVLNDELHHLR